MKYFLEHCKPKIIFTDREKAPIIDLHLCLLPELRHTEILFFKELFIDPLKLDLQAKFDDAEVEAFSCTNLESNKNTAVILFRSTVIGPFSKELAIPHAFFTAPSNQEVPNMLSGDVGLWIAISHWQINLLLTVRAILSYVKAIKISYEKILEPSIEKCLCDTVQKYKVQLY